MEVKDPYRWLESMNSSQTRQWIKEQNQKTQNNLDKIPFREKMKERLREVCNYPKYSAPFHEGNLYFFFKNEGLQNQSVLYIQEGLGSPAEVFLDPNQLSKDGTKALTEYALSKGGKYFAYGVAEGGSDWNEFFVMDVNQRKALPDHLKWIKFSTIAWHGEGFYYTRYDCPEEGEELVAKNENARIFYHKMGTKQSEDILIHQDKNHPLRTAYAVVSKDESYLFVYQREGATNKNALYVQKLTSKPSPQNLQTLAKGFQAEYTVIDNLEKRLIVLTDHEAPKYKLILMDPQKPSPCDWQELIPETKNVIQSASTVGGKLFVTYMQDVRSQVLVYNLDGKYQGEVQLPTLGCAEGFQGEKSDLYTFYTFTSYVHPITIYKYNISTNESEVAHASEAKFDSEKFQTKQVFYSSPDGTQIPMFLTFSKDLTLDGTNPTMLYGYGGFNISLTPSFKAWLIPFLEAGGIYAVANIRGGGEYGEDWHKAGALANKQNVFDDFIAGAEYLIQEKYTCSKKLAIAGGSNGGLLVGACLNQRPDLFQVALPAVGVLDMLRFHRFTIGYAWVIEYGCAENSLEEFRNLYAYSPLHNISEEKDYPAVLITTGDHDDRVVPAHSYKFAAALQEKCQGENPLLIRIATDAGHGAGKPTQKILEEQSDIWSFVFYNLGMEL